MEISISSFLLDRMYYALWFFLTYSFSWMCSCLIVLWARNPSTRPFSTWFNVIVFATTSTFSHLLIKKTHDFHSIHRPITPSIRLISRIPTAAIRYDQSLTKTLKSHDSPRHAPLNPDPVLRPRPTTPPPLRTRSRNRLLPTLLYSLRCTTRLRVHASRPPGLRTRAQRDRPCELPDGHGGTRRWGIWG